MWKFLSFRLVTWSSKTLHANSKFDHAIYAAKGSRFLQHFVYYITSVVKKRVGINQYKHYHLLTALSSRHAPLNICSMTFFYLPPVWCKNWSAKRKIAKSRGEKKQYFWTCTQLDVLCLLLLRIFSLVSCGWANEQAALEQHVMGNLVCKRFSFCKRFHFQSRH